MKLHRLFVLLATALTLSAHADLASLFTNVQRTASIPRRPSILVIQWHDLAYSDLSCYGQSNYLTPNLDRLASEGVRFTHYTGGTDSPTTTATLLSGRFGATDPGITNLAQILQRNGYRTGFIGEWTFDREPWLRGFEQFAGFFTDDEARNYYAPAIWRFPRVFRDESNQVQQVTLDHEPIYHNSGGKKGVYMPELLTRAAKNFIRIAQPDPANRWRPFFLVLNLPAPRSAVFGRDEFPVPSDAPFTGEAWPQAAKNRAALMTRIDGDIGDILGQLEKCDLTNNIAIVFSSSTAPETFRTPQLNTFFRTNDLRSTNNPAPHLPLIVRYPAKVPAGQVKSEPLTAADIAPTLLEIGYAKPEPGITGTSILPLIQAKRGTNTTANLPPRTSPAAK